MKTPAEARKHWAEVLRTDRFKQGIGALEFKSSNGNSLNCCLGVLCRLYIEDGGELEINITKVAEVDKYLTSFNGNTIVLPQQVSEYIGIDSHMGRFTNDDGTYEYLACLNDLGVEFSKIADVIDSGRLDTTHRI